MNHRHHAFTLLELVVVLAILAVVTSLAVRSIDGVEDQRRFEAAQRGLEEISAAVLGSPDDRAADGSRTISGFVADMGRLPRATQEGNVFTLRELWENPSDSEFDIRQAKLEKLGVGANSDDEDEQVFVRGGWRGPYLRLPIGAETLLDAWRNPMVLPVNSPLLDPNARLRNEANESITIDGEKIGFIRHLGANGRAGNSEKGYNKDSPPLDLTEGATAELFVQIEVLAKKYPNVSEGPDDPNAIPKDNSPAIFDDKDDIIVRIFGPNPDDPALIKVEKSPAKFRANPWVWKVPQKLTIGPRVIRATFVDDTTLGRRTTSYDKSAVKHITLRPGINFVELTIDRRVAPFVSTP